MHRVAKNIVGLVGMLAGLVPTVGAFDHSAYDTLLRRHVTEDGLVNYETFRKEALPTLRRYLNALAGADLTGWPYEEKLAFWINAYNAHMVRQVLNRPQLKKVSEDFGIFDVPLRIAKGTYTLNDIEHRILRGKVNSKNKQGPIPGVTLERRDPRIHFALVCAAIDCPKLRNFAYTAANVEATLAENARLFANNPRHVRLENGRLCVSSLMKWFGEDFTAVGGIAAFLTHLTDPSLRKDEAEVDRQLMTYPKGVVFQYDWTLNDLRNAPTR